MKIPDWIKAELEKFNPPATGRVVISLEFYEGGVSKLELGVIQRSKPPVRQAPTNFQDSRRH